MRRLLELLAILGTVAGVYIWVRKSQSGGTVTVEEVVADTVDDVQRTVNKFTARGLRNNNPGNIEYNGTAWQGLASPPSDGRFCIFVSPDYGFRALGHILLNYQKNYGLNTVAGIISRWAPGNENNTVAYIDDVCRQTSLAPDQKINVSDWLGSLAAAITRHENGYNPYPQNDIETWVRLP
jgi:hypothetical protein